MALTFRFHRQTAGKTGFSPLHYKIFIPVRQLVFLETYLKE